MKRLLQPGILALALVAGWPLSAEAGFAVESDCGLPRLEPKGTASLPLRDPSEPELRRSGSLSQSCILPERPHAAPRAELRQQPLKGCQASTPAGGQPFASQLSARPSRRPPARARLHVLLCTWLN
jgi:hypothetical protein